MKVIFECDVTELEEKVAIDLQLEKLLAKIAEATLKKNTRLLSLEVSLLRAKSFECLTKSLGRN